jgi:hypothetical protein
VVNTGRRAGTAKVYAVDAATAEHSGAVYLPATAPRRDVGSWTHLAVGSVRVGPGRSAVVSFRVAIPRGAGGGQHLGGITVADTATRRAAVRGRKGSFHLNIRTLSIVAVQVDLPGPALQKVTPTGVRAGGTGGVQTIDLLLRNEGNRLIKPRGSLVVADSNGRRIRSAGFRLDTFVPHTAIAYPVAVPKRALPPGDYRATVRIQYGGTANFPFSISSRDVRQVFGHQAQGAPSSGGISTLVIVIIVLGALVLGFIAAALFFRARARRTPPA